MAGIFGLLDFSGRTDTRTVAEKLRRVATQGFQFPSAIREFPSGAIGYAFPRLYSDTNWPLVSSDQEYSLIVFGELYLPDDAPLRANNFEEGFLRPFRAWGGQFLSKLNGQFVFALMSERECILVNDANGNFAMHYSHTGQKFAFSSSMMALEEHSQDLGTDERGLFEHLCLSQSLSGRTLLKGVQRLPRGTILTFSTKGLHSEQYISTKFLPTSNYSEALEMVENSLIRAVSRSSEHSKVTAALSGGFDSRMTWSIILRQGLAYEITASTQGLPDSRDMTISNQIANRLGLKTDRFEFDHSALSELPNHWRRFISLTEGLYPLSQIHSYYGLQDLGQRSSVLVDSYGGALYRRQIKKFVERRIDIAQELAPQVIASEITALFRSSLLRPEAKKGIFETALLGLREYYSSIESVANIGDKFDLYYADQTVALRDSICGNLQMNFIGLEHPLLDTTALAAIRRIPGFVRRREGVHKFVIHRSFPKLEQFSLDYSGYPAPYRGFSTFRVVAPAVDRLGRKGSKLIPPLSKLSLRKPPMDARSVLEPGLGRAKELLLTPHREYDWLIDRDALERTFRELETDNYIDALAVIQLLTYRFFLDVFR